jgi:hypothetical protein
MSTKNRIIVELRGNNDVTIHFCSNDPIGATSGPLDRVGYRQDAIYKPIGADAQNLIALIFSIPGVVKLTTEHYSVTLTFGKAYLPDEIIRKVVAIVATLFCYGESLEDIVIDYIGTAKSPDTAQCRFQETHAREWEISRIMR